MTSTDYGDDINISRIKGKKLDVLPNFERSH